jgi:hypothetical protein
MRRENSPQQLRENTASKMEDDLRNLTCRDPPGDLPKITRRLTPTVCRLT